jgi:hypothetical protein
MAATKAKRSHEGPEGTCLLGGWGREKRHDSDHNASGLLGYWESQRTHASHQQCPHPQALAMLFSLGQ